MIVAADADLDEAVPAILQSAFAFAGQKCSAASRVLGRRGDRRPLCERLAGRRRGAAGRPGRALETDVPPVIEREAMERVARYRRAGVADRNRDRPGARARRRRRLVLPGDGRRRPARRLAGARRGDLRAAAGHPARRRRRARLRRSSTASRSRSPAACSPATRAPSAACRERTPVGNLYVNRGITGAMVGRQPFGGNRLSGTGLKAGGPDYLLQFVGPAGGLGEHDAPRIRRLTRLVARDPPRDRISVDFRRSTRHHWGGGAAGREHLCRVGADRCDRDQRVGSRSAAPRADPGAAAAAGAALALYAVGGSRSSTATRRSRSRRSQPA